jgi:hypothetical protein
MLSMLPCADKRQAGKDWKNMSENLEKKAVDQEQKENNSFSFIVGVFIALAIVILLAVFFNK